MSNGWQLELLRADDGGAYLSYWDTLEGEDRLFYIAADGAVYRSGQDCVDLGTELLFLLTILERQSARFRGAESEGA